MKKKLIYELKSLYRDSLRVYAYEFEKVRKAYVWLAHLEETKYSRCISVHFNRTAKII